MDRKESRELCMSNFDKVLKALNEGNIEEAKTCVRTMEKEAQYVRHLGLNYVWTLLTYIGKHYGDDEVIKALRFRHSCQVQVAERMLGMSPIDAVRFKTSLHRVHRSKMTLTEEEDRFVLKLDPCNTGGRMLREGLDKPPVNLGKFRKGVPESWNKSGVSYYCAHCAVHSITSVEKGAPHPTWIYKCPENPQDPCYQYYYKRTEDVPEKYFEELGLKKDPSSTKASNKKL